MSIDTPLVSFGGIAVRVSTHLPVRVNCEIRGEREVHWFTTDGRILDVSKALYDAIFAEAVITPSSPSPPR